ncbi:MAG: hypothetical protein ACOC3V_04170 [bacterium]
MFSLEEIDLIKDETLSKFDIKKCYDLMLNWYGYKPKDQEDVLDIINEVTGILKSSYMVGGQITPCSTAGFSVGFIDSFFIISWTNIILNVKNDVELLSLIRKESNVYSEINYKEFLRSYKINKLWKNKEIVITQENIN